MGTWRILQLRGVIVKMFSSTRYEVRLGFSFGFFFFFFLFCFVLFCFVLFCFDSQYGALTNSFLSSIER